MLKEFKEFALKGNVVDMAVGVIIGGAFGKIISSFVNDVLMPPIGMLVGNVDFSDLSLVLREAAEGKPAVALRYGVFINTSIDFIIVAFAIFAALKAFSTLQHKQPAPPPAPTERACPECLGNIPLEAKRCRHCTSAVTALP